MTPRDWDNEVGLRILELRKVRSIKQQALAKCLEISSASLSQYEHGQRHFTIEFLVNLADVLGVSISYLITGIEDERLPIDQQTLNSLLMQVEGLQAYINRLRENVRILSGK